MARAIFESVISISIILKPGMMTILSHICCHVCGPHAMLWLRSDKRDHAGMPDCQPARIGGQIAFPKGSGGEQGHALVGAVHPTILCTQASLGLVDQDALGHDRIWRMSRQQAGADDPFPAPGLQGGSEWLK